MRFCAAGAGEEAARGLDGRGAGGGGGALPEVVFMGRSFRDSLKVLEADIQHANSM